MKIKSVSALLAIAALGLASSAMAAPATGPYMGVGLGHSSIDVKVPAGLTLEKGGTSYSLTAGLRADKNFAVEADFTRLGNVKVSDGVNSQSGKAQAFSLTGLGFIPVYDKTEAFLRAGLSYTSFEVGSESRHSVQPLLGLGADYHLTPTVALRGEVQYLPSFAGSTDDAVNSKVSVNYRF